MGKGSAFVVGGLIGAAVALLYAPRAGRDTRALVTEKLNATWGEAQEFGRQTADGATQAYQATETDASQAATAFKDRGSEFIRQATVRGNEFVQSAAERGSEFAQAAIGKGQEVYEKAAARVQDAAKGVGSVSIDKGDDLREKIEAARQRIASQVVKNAQEDQGVIEEGVFADAKTAGDVVEAAAEEAVEGTEDIPEEIAAAVEEATQDFEE